jgi:hypothetical protein
MKALFLDCNDQLAPVWQKVVQPDDPPIDVNRRPYPLAELPRVLEGYAICIDDHSYLPTDLVERCDAPRAASRSTPSEITVIPQSPNIRLRCCLPPAAILLAWIAKCGVAPGSRTKAFSSSARRLA